MDRAESMQTAGVAEVQKFPETSHVANQKSLWSQHVQALVLRLYTSNREPEW
jgi:hypothetical protein